MAAMQENRELNKPIISAVKSVVSYDRTFSHQLKRAYRLKFYNIGELADVKAARDAIEYMHPFQYYYNISKTWFGSYSLNVYRKTGDAV